MADRSPGLGKFLKVNGKLRQRPRELRITSHHITLGIGAGAGLVGRISETEKDDAGDPDPQTCKIMKIMDFWAGQDFDGFPEMLLCLRLESIFRGPEVCMTPYIFVFNCISLPL